jgi:DNA-binding NarL/FixJ family response regulator
MFVIELNYVFIYTHFIMDRIRCAIVEDDELTRISLKIGLQGIQQLKLVGEAATARDGLRLIRQQQPDVAIIDLGLPDFSGIELTKQVRADVNPSLQSTKILILTLQDRKDKVMAVFGAGADSYCIKNIEFDRLFEAIKTTHQGNSWIDPAIARIVLSLIKTDNGKYKQQKYSKNYGLTDRELEVLQSIVNGDSNEEIAQKLFIALGTVKSHVRGILNKLAVNDRTQAAVTALRLELVN